MVEYAVDDHLDSVLVERLAHGRKILVGTEAAVDFAVITRIIAVRIGFKNRREIYGICTAVQNMRNPVLHFLNARCEDPVVLFWRPAETKGIDLIENTFVSPHLKKLQSPLSKNKINKKRKKRARFQRQTKLILHNKVENILN